MIIAGIIIIAVAVIVMIVAMGGMFIGVGTGNERAAGGSFVLYFLMAILYVVGIAVTAIGVVQALT